MGSRPQTAAMATQMQKIKPVNFDPELVEAVVAEGFSEDITGSKQACEVVERYLPDVTLTGMGLAFEKDDSWGGSYYRVLKNCKNDKEMCIQWFFIWTKQKIFLPSGGLFIPFTLFLLGLVFFNNFYDETLSFSDYFSDWELFIGIIGMIVVGGIFIFQGGSQLRFAWRQQSKNKHYVPHSWHLIVMGVVFLVFVVFWKIIWRTWILRGGFFHFVVKHLLLWRSSSTEEIELLIPWVSPIFLVVIVINQIIRLKQHDMDWAPLFIYLKHNNTAGWELDKVIYDSYHYYTDTATKAELEKKGFREGETGLPFDIPNYWHSFQLVKSKRMEYMHLVGISGWAGIAFIVSILFNASVAITLLAFIMWLVLGAIGLSKVAPVKLVEPEKIEDKVHIKIIDYTHNLEEISSYPLLSESLFHLTPERINLFWRLEYDAALVIKSKLKNPFIGDFNTFRDEEKKNEIKKK